MAAEEYPLLNGNAPSWADVSTVINVAGGATHKDIDYKSIKWSSKRSFGEQRGASGGRVIRQTTGSIKDEGSCEYYKSGLIKLVEALIPVAPRRGNRVRISMVQFDIVILHSVPGDPKVYHEEMRGCRLSSFESSLTEGDEPEIVPMDLAPMECVWVLEDGTEVGLL